MNTLSPAEIEKSFHALFVKDVGSPPANLSTRRNEIPAWDSLRHAQLIIDVQRHFAIRFTMAEILESESYERLLAIVIARAGSAK